MIVQLRTEHMMNFMSVFEIPVENSYCVKLTQGYLDDGNFVAATKFIDIFDLHDQFDIIDICMQLVETNKP